MLKNVTDRTAYCILAGNPTVEVKNSLKRLNDKWQKDNDVPQILYIKNTNLPRSYGIIKLHKNDHSARIISPCIDSPIADISKFYKDIFIQIAACPRPFQVLENSLEFKEQVNNLKIPFTHT